MITHLLPGSLSAMEKPPQHVPSAFIPHRFLALNSDMSPFHPLFH
jgi:hypothetical protein